MLTLCRNKAKTEPVQTEQSFCTKTFKRKVSSVHCSKCFTRDLFKHSKALFLRIKADKARLILMLIISKKSPLIPRDLSTMNTSLLSSPPSSSSSSFFPSLFFFLCSFAPCNFVPLYCLFLTGVSINQQTDTVFLLLQQGQAIHPFCVRKAKFKSTTN